MMNSLIQLFIGAWLHPWGTMQNVKNQPEGTSIKPAMLFIVLLGLLSGLITSIAGVVAPPIMIASGQVPQWIVWTYVGIVPFVYFVGSFVTAFIVWTIFGGILRGSKSSYKTVYRLMAVPVAFYPVSTLVATIPKAGVVLAIVVNLWAFVVLVKGVIIVLDTPPVRTWITFILLFVFMVFLALAAGVNAQRDLASTRDFSDFDTNFGELNQDLSAEDEDLEAQLKELANQAKSKK